ncbi:MAG: hypothetical protein KatS3mg040_1770 [Candidatus Kapaibacterium sp.]|nr:MAG: hypothetical protein KatS3mg040_1770 [Candidatus Kapabacteria bacterium]
MLRWIILAAIAGVAVQSQQLAVRTVATNLDTPWEILWGPDGWLWVTERPGRISRINPETGEQRTLAMLADVYEQGESGMLGMALHPNFADSPHVFVAYTWREGSQILERIVRFTYDGSTLGDMRILLDRIPGATIHDGCRLLILPDRTLLVTTGDANVASRAQDLQSLSGKVLRLRLDGTIPDDNPFPGNPVWSLGHRNAQGLAWHEGILYSSEHGPNSDDEINIIERGRNYGWPDVMGYCDSPTEAEFCRTHAVAEPIAAWTPTVAPCGLAYYAGGQIPQWENSLLLTTLKASRLIVLTLDSTRRRVVSQQQYLAGQLGRLRCVCVSPDGRIFLGTSNRDGRGSPQPNDDRIVELAIATSAVPEQPTGSWWVAVGSTALGNVLTVPVPEPGPLRLELADLGGRWQRTWDFGAVAQGELQVVLSTIGLPSGVYLLTLAGGNRPPLRQLVILAN